ncbi:glycosyltransferase [Butyrivibrio sp. NC2007]|uniref:glycosyltransferase n=1 Tax=Butyrivibrio sp. NC2007 TaxID=1280683 RepID=UPI0003B7AF61|nr:glycosyltransferase [Butyrivibrio sp. NC2007]
MKFSIIVPTYNVEKYLSKCLESILAQTCSDWEAICIDDGSTDSSSIILKRFAEQDLRFRVISQTNQGLAETRNVGIRAAQGDWLLFVDSDDFIRNDTLEILNKTLVEDNLDAISFETEILYEGDSRERDNKDSWYYKYHDYPNTTSGEKLFEKMMRNNEYCDSACLLAVKKKWILDSDLFFYKGILYEDSIFSMKVFLNASRMRHISSKLYTYRVREASIMTSGFSKENVRSRIIVFKELLKLINQRDYSEEVKKQFFRYVYLVADHIRRMDKMCENSDELQLDATDDFIARILNVSSYKNMINTHILLSGVETIVKNNQRVALYGAGKAGNLMLYFLSSCNLKEKVGCFLVSKKYDLDQKIQGVPLVSLDDYEYRGELVIICVMDYAARKEIMNNLEKKGVKNIEFCDENMFLALERFSM